MVFRPSRRGAMALYGRIVRAEIGRSQHDWQQRGHVRPAHTPVAADGATVVAQSQATTPSGRAVLAKRGLLSSPTHETRPTGPLRTPDSFSSEPNMLSAGRNAAYGKTSDEKRDEAIDQKCLTLIAVP